MNTEQLVKKFSKKIFTKTGRLSWACMKKLANEMQVEAEFDKYDGSIDAPSNEINMFGTRVKYHYELSDIPHDSWNDKTEALKAVIELFNKIKSTQDTCERTVLIEKHKV